LENLKKKHLKLKKVLYLLLGICLYITNIEAAIVGATKGNVDVSQGGLSYNLKMITPKGVAGVMPPLGIGYSSSSDTNSVLGVGFYLNGLSTISKCYEDQKSYYCLDGQKLLLLDESVTYGSQNSEYRLEINNQTKIIKQQDSFIVYTKDGQIGSYGNTLDSKDGDSFYRINQSKDRFGNKINFKYSNTNDDKYITQISYANNTIDFNYETRDDKELLYSHGVKINFDKRLKDISIKTANTEVTSYNFTYNYIDNKARIINIQECSQGECLEPLEFNWTTKENNTILEEAKLQYENTDSSLKDWEIYTYDINNDSYPDLIQSYKGANGHKLKVSLGDGKNFGETQLLFEDTNSALKDWEIYVRDINGDSYPDLIESYKGANGHKLKVSLNTRESFEETKSWFEDTNSALKDWEIYLQDINSDSYPDLIQSYKGASGHKLKVSLNNGTSFADAQTWLDDSNSALKDWTISLNDINGDTLLDIIQTYKWTNGHKLKVSLNKGNNSFNDSVVWFEDTSSNLKDWEIYLQDMNGDGLDDLVESYKGTSGHKFKVSLNTGEGFEIGKLWIDDPNSALKDYQIYAQDINNDSYPDLIQVYVGTSGHKLKVSLSDGIKFKETISWLDDSNSALKDYQLYLRDINGDLYPDLIESYKGTNGHKFKVHTNKDHVTKVENITNNKDEDINIVYTTLQNKEIYSSTSTSIYPKIDIKASAMVVVKSLSNDNGVGGENETLFQYKDFKVDLKKGSLGFGQTTTITPVVDSKTIVNFIQEFPLVGVKSSSESFVNDIKIQDEQIELNIKKYFTNQNILNLESAHTIQNKYDIDGTYLLTKETKNSNFDRYGNIGEIETITKDNTTQYKQIATNIYTNDVANWILSRLINATVKHINNDGSIITKNSSFAYDAITGILNSETIEPNSTKSLSKLYKYDSYGNKISETIKVQGQTDRVNTFEYDEQHKNIIRVTNPLGFMEQNIYDINNQVVKHTDINGLVTTVQYDKMGKKIKETRADGTTTTWEHKWDSSVANSLYTVTQTSTGVPPVTIYYNRFNKKLRTTKTAFDGLKIYEDTFYDEKGNVVKSTTPYYSGETVSYVYNSYDNLNRQTQLKIYDKEGNEIITNFTYDGLNIITTNPKGHIKTIFNNILGKKTKVVEEDSFINYKYDATGNLIQTIDSKSNTITLKYDIFGNKIYQDDPDMGIWSYEYDALGQLVKQTDAKGQITTITYDILGRVTEKNENGQISKYLYDISPNAKGKIFSSSQEGYKKEYYYDKLSRVSNILEFIDNKQFKTSYIYNNEGKLHQTIHPNGFVLENEYNTQGYLSALKSPIEQDNLSIIDLKENIQKNLDNKINSFNMIIELNTQIELYRTKALQILELAKQYKGVDSAIYEQLNKTAAYLIETSLELRTRAQEYKTQYETYKKQLDFYTLKILNNNDEYLYKWLIEKYSSYTTTLISQALDQLNSALSVLSIIDTDELLAIYKDMIVYRIQEAKTIIYEAKNTQERYKNYQEKYTNLTEDMPYKGMFDNSEYKYYYKILKSDVFGRITKIFHGNGLVTNKTYATHNGQLTHITTGYNDNNDIREIQYTYDVLNNVTQKQDHKQNITQTYTYDTLDRIKSAQTISTNSNTTLNYAYDSIGNMTHKSDLGDYTYLKAHQVKTAGDITYTYDNNGNVIEKIKGNETTQIEYNAYNKPIMFQNSDTTTRFYYNPERSRYKKTQNDTTTYYISKHYEEEITLTSILQKNFIYAGDKLVAIHTTTDNGKLKLPQNRYLHTDSLGSVDTITNESGIVIQRLSYNPFGKQIVQEWINDNQANTPIVKRGYTGHEHIKEHDLIHMNGRVYDPTTGRFLSADPHIQAPYDTQSYNRYSYVKNNPLKYTDPSGFFFGDGDDGDGWGGAIGRALGAIGRAIGRALGAIGSAIGSAGRAIGSAIGAIGKAIGNALGDNKDVANNSSNPDPAPQEKSWYEKSVEAARTKYGDTIRGYFGDDAAQSALKYYDDFYSETEDKSIGIVGHELYDVSQSIEIQDFKASLQRVDLRATRNQLAFAPAAAYVGYAAYTGIAALGGWAISKFTEDARLRTVDALMMDSVEDIVAEDSYINAQDRDSKRMSNKKLEQAAKRNGYKDAHDMKNQLGLDSKSDIYADKNGDMYSGGTKGHNRSLDPLGHNVNGD